MGSIGGKAPDGTGPAAIQHTVAFRLRDAVDLDRFLDRCRGLATIPGVADFEVLVQVGAKSSFTHALSMWFADDRAYADYDAHPDHRAFVEDVWLPNVAEFLELDYRRKPAAT
ncbi:MAG: Dabb family protein [Actinomycetota bacterium]